MPNTQHPLPPPLLVRRHEIIYKIRLSTLYHRKRERFFDIVDKAVSGLVLTTATAAVTSLFQGVAGAEKSLAAITACLSLIPVVLTPAQKARHHNQLSQRYCQLLATCTQAGEDWTEAQCNQFSAQLIEISASEPTPLTALVADCQNELAISYNEGPAATLKWHHHLLKHLLDVRPAPTP